MFGSRDRYRTTGTTSPIFVPQTDSPATVRFGEKYFFVQIVGAQAAFTGSVWDRVKSLIVTSQVNLNHPVLGNESVSAIRRSIEVQRNRAEQLGMSPNLIKLVPATMTNVTLSIEFVLDKENQLAKLAGLINTDAFLSVISLAPGAATAARAIGGLSQKLLGTFIKAEDRQPILQFGGDLNIASGMQEGYYIILGTRDEDNPLPDPLPVLEVRGGFLYAGGEQVTQLSYVIINVRCVDARTRDLNDGAAWEENLAQAESTASNVSNNPLARSDAKTRAWDDCLKDLQEAQTLLRADPNYLRSEAETIITAAYAECYSRIFGQPPTRRAGPAEGSQQPVEAASGRDRLSIPPDKDMEQVLDQYADQVASSRRILQSSGITG